VAVAEIFQVGHFDNAEANRNIPQNIVDVYRNNFASQLTPEARDAYVKNLGR